MTNIGPTLNTLSAISAYTSSSSNNVNARTIPDAAQIVRFQDEVNAQIHRYNNMSPTQILDQIKMMAHDQKSRTNSDFVTTSVSTLSNIMQQHENVARKSIKDKSASLDEIVRASSSAKNAISIASKLREMMQTALDKILDMNI